MTYYNQSLLGLPGPTVFYTALYLLALVVHWWFVSYILAGTVYLTATTFGRRLAPEDPRLTDPIRETLRDWMPFALSAAITAGVAPLLFLQVLYKRPFYTANLLLFHRWMAILPVLIVGFYLTYLLKARRADRWRSWPTSVIGLAACACFGFTGYSWSENHLLSLDAGRWQQIYASGMAWHRGPVILPRVALWFSLAWPGMASLLALQLFVMKAEFTPHRLARWPLAGLAAAVVASVWYIIADRIVRTVAMGSGASPWLFMFLLGVAVQIGAWIRLYKGHSLTKSLAAWAAAGFLLTALGIAGFRETIRVNGSHFRVLFDDHAQAARVGGFCVFLAFAGLNAVLIALCACVVRRGRNASP